MASPFDVAREWGGCLRPFVFHVPKPILPASTVSFLHYAGVPATFEVAAHQRVRFEFLPEAVNLADVWKQQATDYSMPVGWGRFWRIGDITYTQAAAWLCIEELSGRVFAVDVGDDQPLRPVNESVEGMVRCMRLISDWAVSADGSIARVAALLAALGQDAALAAGESAHYWIPLVEEAIESGCERLEARYT